MRSQICTCHDSPAVMTCAKLRPDLIIIFHARATQIVTRLGSKTVWAMGPCMPEGRLILISSLTSIYNSNFIMINTPWCAYLMYVYCVNCHYCNNDLFSWQYITPIQAKLFFACSCNNECYELYLSCNVNGMLLMLDCGYQQGINIQPARCNVTQQMLVLHLSLGNVFSQWEDIV